MNDDTFHVCYMPKGMGRLISPGTLIKFVVSGGSNSSKASSLGRLENLDQLQGSLFLRKFGNVADVAEVKQVALCGSGLLH